MARSLRRDGSGLGLERPAPKMPKGDVAKLETPKHPYLWRIGRSIGLPHFED